MGQLEDYLQQFGQNGQAVSSAVPYGATAQPGGFFGAIGNTVNGALGSLGGSVAGSVAGAVGGAAGLGGSATGGAAGAAGSADDSGGMYGALAANMRQFQHWQAEHPDATDQEIAAARTGFGIIDQPSGGGAGGTGGGAGSPGAGGSGGGTDPFQPPQGPMGPVYQPPGYHIPGVTDMPGGAGGVVGQPPGRPPAMSSGGTDPFAPAYGQPQPGIDPGSVGSSGDPFAPAYNQPQPGRDPATTGTQPDPFQGQYGQPGPGIDPSQVPTGGSPTDPFLPTYPPSTQPPGSGGSGTTQNPRAGTGNGTSPPDTPLEPIPIGNNQPPSLGPPVYPGGGGGGTPTVPTPTDNNTPGNAALANSLFQGFQSAQDAAKAANEQRYGQILQGYSGLANEQAGRLDAITGGYGNRLNDATQQYANTLGGYNDVTGNAANQYGGILGAYGDLTNRVMGRLDGLGQSAATNINQAADQQNAANTQNLISRGLGNTTIAPNVQRGVESDRQRQLTQLSEDLANQKNTADQTNTGAMLGAAGQFTGNLSQLGTQGLQAAERFTGAQADLSGQGLQYGERANATQTGTGQDILNFMGSRTDAYPSYETLANLAVGLGQAGMPIPSMPAPGPTSAPYLPTPDVSFFQQGNQPYTPPAATTPAPGNAPVPGAITARPTDPRVAAVIQGYNPAA